MYIHISIEFVLENSVILNNIRSLIHMIIKVSIKKIIKITFWIKNKKKEIAYLEKNCKLWPRNSNDRGNSFTIEIVGYWRFAFSIAERNNSLSASAIKH